MSHNPRVAVIGAGCSGLTSVKNLIQAGVKDLVCYEQNDDIGGNWYYSANNSHSSVCETTHIISSKKLSEYVDFPMPEHYPDYPSHQQVFEYFKSYAEHFKLYPYIKFNTSVEKAEKLADERWQLRLSNGEVEVFDYLVVANGHHNKPRHPNYPGQFEGDYLHAHDYKHNRDERFIDKKVLVVGAGNSGCDCAVEISRVAAQTAISMRKGYYIIPKFMLGKPTDTFNETLLKMPKFIQGPLRKVGLWLQVGDYRDYGLEKPDYSILKSHPVVNSELLYKIRHGKVQPKKDILRFEGKQVHFADGSVDTFDTVLAATGYHISFPFFDPDFINFDFDVTDRVPLYLRMFHPTHKTLIFVGLFQPQGAIWPLSDLQAKLAGNYIMGRYQLPSQLKQLAEADADRISRDFIRAARHTIEVHYHSFRKDLLKAIPANAPS
jgi:hypothetical protein